MKNQKKQNTKERKADVFGDSEGSTANRLREQRKAKEKRLKEIMGGK